MVNLNIFFNKKFNEFLIGMMNIAPCGRQCTSEERKIFHDFDEIHKIRVNMIKALKEEFQDVELSYGIGGQISFDVYPVGWDKTFCLSRLPKNKFKEIHFFGDQTEPGGNDYEIFEHPLTISHKVYNFQDTRKILTEMFNL
jgi:phosphomannomutase